MQFQLLTPAHVDVIRPFFDSLASRTCDLTPGTVLMWRGVNGTEFSVHENGLFLRMHGRTGVLYLLPLSEDPVSSLRRLCEEEGAVRLSGVPAEYLPALERTFTLTDVCRNRDYFDYLYRFSDLCTLSGKKYAKKRNLISQFDRSYPDAVFSPITNENRAQVIAFWQKLERGLGESAGRVEQLEREGTSSVLSDENLCSMTGGALSVAGTIVGFSLGEVVGDTLFTHIEKADRAYKGVYQKLTNSFVRLFEEKELSYVNREDDAGDEGLRRAKLDYHPCALLEKFSLTVNK